MLRNIPDFEIWCVLNANKALRICEITQKNKYDETNRQKISKAEYYTNDIIRRQRKQSQVFSNKRYIKLYSLRIPGPETIKM